MKKVYVLSLMIGVALFSLSAATALAAQTMTDSLHRKEQHRTDLTGTPNNMEVITSIIEIKPGESSELHFHHGVEAFYVIQGALIQLPGKAPTMLPTDFNSLNLRDVRHGSFKIVGDTPLKLFTVHIVDKGKPLYDYA